MGKVKQDKYLWSAKVGNKGQIVIPNEARKIFGINKGDTLLLLCDVNRGIVIEKYEDYIKFTQAIFDVKEEKGIN